MCDCGNTKEVVDNYLITGTCTSCGCLRRELAQSQLKELNKTAAIRATKHGHATHGISSEYTSWKAMIERCTRKKCTNYSYYGGRGIRVCDRWRGRGGFQNFLADLGLKPDRTYSIERVDNEGNYEPHNCVWATKKEQANNRRKDKSVRQIAQLEQLSGLSIEALIKHYEDGQLC